MTVPLSTWTDGAAKDAILAYVEGGLHRGLGRPAVPVAERIATFDNDGTLWCEKPMPIQLDFILRRLAEMAEADPALRDRQPWKAARERDYAWLARVLDEHYAGDDTNVQTLAGGVVAAFGNITVDEFEASGRVPAQCSASHVGPGLSRLRLRTRWSSSSGSCGRTGSRTTSRRAAAETS